MLSFLKELISPTRPEPPRRQDRFRGEAGKPVQAPDVLTAKRSAKPFGKRGGAGEKRTPTSR